MVTAAAVSSSHETRFLLSDLNELCDRLILLLQEKLTGNNSDITDSLLQQIDF